MPFNDMKLEAEFKTWTKKYNINDPDNPKHFYDYRSAFLKKIIPIKWKDLPAKDQKQDMMQIWFGQREQINPDDYMWPDKFKLKGHPIPPE